MNDHVDDQLIGHQVAAIHEFLRGATKVGATLAMLTQQVATGDHGYAERRGQKARLRALSRAGRTEQQDHVVVPLQPHRCSSPL